MTAEDISKVTEEAQKASAQAVAKIAEANDAMNKLRAFKSDIDKEYVDLEKRRKAVEVMEKRLHYLKLKLIKLVDEKNLDAEIKTMIEGAVSGS